MRDGLVMMALGPYRFGVNRGQYQTFTRTAAFRWTKVDRIGRAPAMQFMGADAEEISLNGVIYPHFKGGLRQAETMRLLAGLGRPLLLVDGLGFVWKRWCIVEVSETRSLLMANGAPRKIDFDMRLQSYGEDRLF